MQTALFLIKISQFSSLIPVIIGLFFYKKLNKSFKRLVWFLLFFVIMEYLAFWLSQKTGNNMPLSHIFTVIEFGMLFSIFTSYFKIPLKYYFIMLLLFLFVAIIDAYLLKNINTFSSLAKPIESAIFTISALFFYYKNLNNNQHVDLFKQPMFWFSTSILIYFPINFFMFLLLNTFLKESINTDFVDNNVHSITNTIANVLYAMVFFSFKWKT